MVKEKRSFFEKFEAEAYNMAGEYIKDKVKNKVIRVSEMSIAFLLSAIFLSIAIVELTAKFFPVLDGGWNYLIYGMIFLIIGLFLK